MKITPQILDIVVVVCVIGSWLLTDLTEAAKFQKFVGWIMMMIFLELTVINRTMERRNEKKDKGTGGGDKK